MRYFSADRFQHVVEQLEGLPWPVQLVSLAEFVAPFGWVKGEDDLIYWTGLSNGLPYVELTHYKGEVQSFHGPLIDIPLEDRRIEEVSDAYVEMVSSLKQAWGKPRKVRARGARFTAWDLSGGGVAMVQCDEIFLGFTYLSPQGEKLFDGFFGK